MGQDKTLKFEELETTLENLGLRDDDKKMIINLTKAMLELPHENDLVNRLRISIRQLHNDGLINERAKNALINADITRVGELVQLHTTTILGIKRLGVESLYQIENAVRELELSLGMHLPNNLDKLFPLPKHLH